MNEQNAVLIPENDAINSPAAEELCDQKKIETDEPAVPVGKSGVEDDEPIIACIAVEVAGCKSLSDKEADEIDASKPAQRTLSGKVSTISAEASEPSPRPALLALNHPEEEGVAEVDVAVVEGEAPGNAHSSEKDQVDHVCEEVPHAESGSRQISSQPPMPQPQLGSDDMDCEVQQQTEQLPQRRSTRVEIRNQKIASKLQRLATATAKTLRAELTEEELKQGLKFLNPAVEIPFGMSIKAMSKLLLTTMQESKQALTSTATNFYATPKEVSLSNGISWESISSLTESSDNSTVDDDTSSYSEDGTQEQTNKRKRASSSVDNRKGKIAKPAEATVEETKQLPAAKKDSDQSPPRTALDTESRAGCMETPSSKPDLHNKTAPSQKGANGKAQPPTAGSKVGPAKANPTQPSKAGGAQTQQLESGNTQYQNLSSVLSALTPVANYRSTSAARPNVANSKTGKGGKGTWPAVPSASKTATRQESGSSSAAGQASLGAVTFNSNQMGKWFRPVDATLNACLSSDSFKIGGGDGSLTVFCTQDSAWKPCSTELLRGLSKSDANARNLLLLKDLQSLLAALSD